MGLVADQLGEIEDHLRVGEVLALRGGRHHQMVLHQPGHQLGVPERQLVALAEGLGVHRTEFRVVAATALGDVVVEASDVDQFRLGQTIDDLARQRIFLGHLRPIQLAQVLDQVEGVGVHRIDMEQVVLHLPDDMAELRQVATEDAVAVHPPQVAVDTLAALEQLDEQAGVADVVAELVVDQVSAVAQQANGVGAHALDFRVLGHQHEDFQEGERGALEDVRVRHLDVAVAQLEATVQRLDLHRLLAGQDDFLEVLDDQVVQLGDRHHHPVVLLHEAFDRQFDVVVFVAEQTGDAALVIEQQAILGAPGEHVQGIADPPEELLAGSQHAALAFHQEAFAHQGVQVEAAELAAGHPEDGLMSRRPPGSP